MRMYSIPAASSFCYRFEQALQHAWRTVGGVELSHPFKPNREIRISTEHYRIDMTEYDVSLLRRLNFDVRCNEDTLQISVSEK